MSLRLYALGLEIASDKVVHGVRMPQALFDLVGTANVPFLAQDLLVNRGKRDASGGGTHHRHDLTEITHNLQMPLLVLFTVRNDNLGARLGYEPASVG